MSMIRKAADYLIAAVLVIGVLSMQSCTDDNGDDGMPVGAACRTHQDAFVKCGRSQFRPA
jgi:hypothetical protein